ncbi:hypothetical protein GGQ84_002860 [Desulfitispora alkaliphila]|uniref:Gmad2 immunoglobulin-like domain-containing protein n=1 Tax=Desulfitispora alkaliphila TaxID=622674 RepID=UPI003D260C93
MWRILFIVTIAGVLILSGCHSNAEREELEGFNRPKYDELDSELQQWINRSQELYAVQEREYEGNRYLLLTMGEDRGYQVEVEEAVAREEELKIMVNVVEPGPGQTADDNEMEPAYDLIVLGEEQLPFNIVDRNDKDRYFMKLVGLDYVKQPIVASSEWIKLLSPEPSQHLDSRKINISGLASVFEGTVMYEVTDETGDVLTKGFTQAAMGDWGYFEEQIELEKEPDGNQIFLQLYSESAKDSSRMFTVVVPLLY